MAVHRQSRCIFVFLDTVSAGLKKPKKRFPTVWSENVHNGFFFTYCSCINLPCHSLILTVSLHVSFVFAEYLRGDVLPAEQYAASDLPCLLHPNSHLKALMGRDAPQTDERRYVYFNKNKTVTSCISCFFLRETFFMHLLSLPKMHTL